VPEAEVAAVLDASALMAVLHDEDGADEGAEAIANGAAISVVNWAEVLTQARRAGPRSRAGGN
jgi:ribonuclease VapC